MTSMPPKLTDEQRRAAAVKSLQLRQERASVKARLAQGVPLWPFWDHEAVQGMKVLDLLRAMPGIGPKKATALLDSAGIDVKRTVRACGPKQKERLLEQLT